MSQNRTQFVILSLLRVQPSAGHEIHDFCKTRFSYFWQESYGQIYPNLTQMDKDGSIKKVPGTTKRGAKYEITALGLKKLETWLKAAPSPKVIRDELFLKLFCGTAADASIHRTHIANAKEIALQEVSVLQDSLAEIELMEGVHPDVGYWRLIIRAGILSLEARLAWCDEVEQELRGDKN